MSAPTTRRQFLHVAGAGTLGVAATGCLPGARPGQAARRAGLGFYVGTYTDGASEGIYRARLDPGSGALTLDGATAAGANPSFLALDRTGRTLYAVNETTEYEGQPSGAVAAFAIAPETGALALINRQPSRGGAPCHVALDRAGRFVLVANYVGGNVAVLPVGTNGRLGEAVAVAQRTGSGPDRRQAAPHAHMVQLDAANRHALVADLGTDRLAVYRFDAGAGTLALLSEASLRPGAGPRHFAFGPDGRRVYVLNELNSTITAFDYDADRGALAERGTASTLPAGYAEPNSGAHVLASADGRFVYASNRGHDSIAVFAADRSSGALTPVEHVPTGGRRPRNFALDPSGRFLLAANQDSGTVASFAVDAATGQLTPTGARLDVPAPVCVVFA